MKKEEILTIEELEKKIYFLRKNNINELANYLDAFIYCIKTKYDLKEHIKETKQMLQENLEGWKRCTSLKNYEEHINYLQNCCNEFDLAVKILYKGGKHE